MAFEVQVSNSEWGDGWELPRHTNPERPREREVMALREQVWLKPWRRRMVRQKIE
jgi:hypothetical protein